jgi:hypothetical protein
MEVSLEKVTRICVALLKMMRGPLEGKIGGCAARSDAGPKESSTAEARSATLQRRWRMSSRNGSICSEKGQEGWAAVEERWEDGAPGYGGWCQRSQTTGDT